MATTPFGWTVSVWPSVVMTEGDEPLLVGAEGEESLLRVGRGIVVDPITNPPEARLIGIPLIVAPGPPLFSVDPLITTALLGPKVKVCPFVVMTDD